MKEKREKESVRRRRKARNKLREGKTDRKAAKKLGYH